MSADPSSAKKNPVFAAWGFDYYKMGVATGKIVSRILKGEKPVNIPTKFMTDPSDVTLIINLDVAKKIGIKVPESILKKATVIKDGKIVKN
jgi:putative ABC transport system substrate-binding protein